MIDTIKRATVAGLALALTAILAAPLAFAGDPGTPAPAAPAKDSKGVSDPKLVACMKDCRVKAGTVRQDCLKEGGKKEECREKAKKSRHECAATCKKG